MTKVLVLEECSLHLLGSYCSALGRCRKVLGILQFGLAIPSRLLTTETSRDDGTLSIGLADTAVNKHIAGIILDKQA